MPGRPSPPIPFSKPMAGNPTTAAGPEAARAEQRLERVVAAFSTLSERYVGAEPGFEATYEIRLADVGRTWEVRVQGDRCVVRPPNGGEPDVVLVTDAPTWLALREGRLSGIDAFAQRRLSVRGDLDRALGFEGLFRLPNGRPPLLRIANVEIGGARISTLIAGSGPEQVICLHGLGSNKASFFETISALTPEHTVHAIDLPGFGYSSKPARAPYNAAWFAERVEAYMDTLGIDRAHLIGNSLGGRVALEAGLREPERVASLGLLAPAVAFRRRREFAPLVWLARPELAAIPHPISADRVRETFWGLFAQPERLDPAVADVVADEFCKTYRSRTGRIAFAAAARSIYLDAPDGERGFWTRLREPGAALAVRLGRPRPARARGVCQARRRGASRRAAGRICPTAATSPRSSCRSAPTGCCVSWSRRTPPNRRRPRQRPLG